MPVSLTIDKQLKRVTMLLEGDYSIDDLKSLINELALQPAEDQIFEYDQLIIQRDARFPGTTKDVVEIVELRASFDSESSMRRIALVHMGLDQASLETEEIFMEAKQLTSIQQGNIQSFDDVEKATEWLDRK